MKSMSLVIDSIEVEVDYKFTPGTSEHFSGSFGNWLPGECDEIELQSVVIGGFDLIEVLTDEFLDKVEIAIVDRENAAS